MQATIRDRVVVKEGDDEQSPNSIDPTISLHTLTGIQPRSDCTMHIYVFINGTTLRALLDSGSTHNFVDSEAASRAGIVFTAQRSLRMAVANGDRVASSGCCHNLKISIADEDFVIDCYELALGSYEMVLGVQWLASLGPILWDLEK
jgi:predicted aspartyl protease